jgi:putative phosphoesterase
MLIGVISDTHGLLRAEAVDALRGSELIIHAGDVGKPEILDQLAAIAPVKAIRGNVDTQPWARRLPETRVVEADGMRLFIIHDRKQLAIPDRGKYAAIISGHSHKPGIDWTDGKLFLNPGSAGPRRFKLPVTIARLRVSPAGLEPEIVEIDV